MTALIVYFFSALLISFICSLLESVLLSVSHAHIAVLVKEGRKRGVLCGLRVYDGVDRRQGPGRVRRE